MANLINSLRFAFDIIKGSLNLLTRYPVLAVPLLPVFLTVIGLEFALVFIIQDLLSALILIFVVAFELMFSFAITANMIHQIHEDRKPSLIEAITSENMVKIIPKVFLLSVIWFILVLILIAIEIVVKGLLSRIDEDGHLADRLLNAIFGTIADALRMMGFMLIPIMIFEKTGLRQGFRRLRATLSESPIAALSGLALTKIASALIFLIVVGISQLNIPMSILGSLILWGMVGIGWMLSMYLEQLFVTGLYLYAVFPESKVVGILLGKHIGIELPSIPMSNPT